MPTFRVDPAAITRSTHDELIRITRSLMDEGSSFADLDKLADSTGDPACGAALRAFVQQWTYEIRSAHDQAQALHGNLMSARTEYDLTEAAIAGGSE